MADDDLFSAWMDEDFGVATQAQKTKRAKKKTFGKKISYGTKKKGMDNISIIFWRGSSFIDFLMMRFFTPPPHFFSRIRSKFLQQRSYPEDVRKKESFVWQFCLVRRRCMGPGRWQRKHKKAVES